MRALVPLDYTEEEKLATAPLKDRVAASIARISKRADGKVLKGQAYVNEVMDNLPTSTKGLFAYYIDWIVVQQHKVIDTKIKPWIRKKLNDLLGEEEEGLVNYITSKMYEQVKPADIVKELKDILDADAEPFVKLLWRRVILETTRAEQRLG